MSEPRPLRILILEDSADDAALIDRQLRRAGVDCQWERVDTEAEFLARLDPSPDLILADYRLPHYGAMAALRALRSRAVHVPVIVVSGTIGEEAAAECLREGATDYLLKDRLARLGQAVRNAVEQDQLRAEQQRAVEALRQAQKMDAIGRLAGGIAHDFNNILNAILGYAGLVADQLTDRPALLAQVEEIVKAGERGAALTGQLLAFSRKQNLRPRLVDLSSSVAGVEAMLRRLIGEHVELVGRLAPALRRVMVDPGQIEQVIVNLAVNARDAMPGGGQLVIETADVELDEAQAGTHTGARPGPYVLLAVSDSGCGMDAATRARIFEPFFTTKEPGKGTGLGLATVYGIVHQSGGCIEVDSEPGHGTSFRIYLPRASGVEESPEPAAARPARPRGGAETVLVLEDDAALRRLVSTLLERAGYKVLAEETAAAAIATAETHAGRIHLVLTDVVMPMMSGPQVAARLAVVRPEARLLYMSGDTGNMIGARGLVPAGAALLEKPFTERSLLLKVRSLLDGAEPT